MLENIMTDIKYIALHGELDTINIEKFEDEINTTIENISEPSILALGFYDVNFINSTAIGHFFLRSEKLEKKQSKIAIIGINKNVKEIFDFVWLSDEVSYYMTMEDLKKEVN